MTVDLIVTASRLPPRGLDEPVIP